MDFALPELGEGVYEAELVGWLVQPGEAVKRGQPLLEVMTDKATMEVPAPFAGRIRSVRGKEGQTVKVGEVVLTYAGVDQPAPLAAPKSTSASAPAVAANGATAGAAGGLPVK